MRGCAGGYGSFNSLGCWRGPGEDEARGVTMVSGHHTIGSENNSQVTMESGTKERQINVYTNPLWFSTRQSSRESQSQNDNNSSYGRNQRSGAVHRRRYITPCRVYSNTVTEIRTDREQKPR